MKAMDNPEILQKMPVVFASQARWLAENGTRTWIAICDRVAPGVEMAIGDIGTSIAGDLERQRVGKRKGPIYPSTAAKYARAVLLYVQAERATLTEEDLGGEPRKLQVRRGFFIV